MQHHRRTAQFVHPLPLPNRNPFLQVPMARRLPHRPPPSKAGPRPPPPGIQSGGRKNDDLPHPVTNDKRCPRLRGATAGR